MNGSISPETTQSINWGGTTSFTITPDEGFKIAGVVGTCPGSLNDHVFTTDFITNDCSVVATFSPIIVSEPERVSVIPSVVGHGTISLPTTQRIAKGEFIRFTLTPASGHSIANVHGTCAGTLDGNVFTTDNIHEDCAVIAIFTPNSGEVAQTFNVIPSVVGQGIITPSITQTIEPGESVNFTLSPANGYELSDVIGTCNGSLDGNTYQTDQVNDDCAVVAVFTPSAGTTAPTYSVIPSVIGNGSMTPDSTQPVSQGDSVQFSLTPADGFSIGSIKGTCRGSLIGTTYTTDAIFSDCSVVATFIPDAGFILSSFSVIPVAIDHGTISPATTQTINQWARASFTITPDPGYSIASVGGTCKGTLTGTTYTTDAIVADCSVVATFIADTNLINVNVIPIALDNGSIDPASNQTVRLGETLSLSILPDDGYGIATVMGTCQGTLTGTTFTTAPVQETCLVIASFTRTDAIPSVFSVIPSIIGSGSITPNTTQTITEGTSTSFNLTPDIGFRIAGISGTCSGTLDSNTFTTAEIHSDCSVVASFEPTPVTLPTTFRVFPVAASNGSISPAATQTINEGDSTSFTITPDPGYTIASVNGTCGGNLDGTTYTTSAISTNCSVVANFSMQAPSAPSLTMTPQQSKTFAFTWQDVANETEYRLLENSDGNSGYSEIATIAANETSYQLEVFLPGRINASYILAACNSSGCSDSAPYFVTSSLAEATAYVKASNSQTNIEFGYSVTLSADGLTMAVGAPSESSNAAGINGDQTDTSAPTSGAVYVFTRNSSHNDWQQQAYLKASNSNSDAFFGHSLTLSADGNTLAVGAIGESSNATGINGDQNDTSLVNSGAVYVFIRSSETWSQQSYVKASNTDANDRFGWSLALTTDGNTLAVGAIGESSNATGIDGDQTDNSLSESGAVYVFQRNASSIWSQQAYVKASNTGSSDQFGYSVALSGDGDTMSVGARYEDSSATGINGDQSDNSAQASGAVYIFTRSGNSWSQQEFIKASNTNFFDSFGSDVALSEDGNTLVVGAPLESSNATGIDGDQVNNLATNSGAVYVFTRVGTTWSQQAYIKASNTDEENVFGWNIALSADGDILAVGSVGDSSNASGINGDQSDRSAEDSGAVYLFKRNGSNWEQLAYVKASNTREFKLFGFAVSLSGDGKTMAIGARTESSNAIGVNGDQTDTSATRSGAVYIF